jgi:Fe-S-cluster containining protein
LCAGHALFDLFKVAQFGLTLATLLPWWERRILSLSDTAFGPFLHEKPAYLQTARWRREAAAGLSQEQIARGRGLRNPMRRQERRVKLKQSVAEVSRHGMDLRATGPDQSWAVIAATRILLDLLEGKSPSRASNTAKRAHEFFETSLKNNPSPGKIECAKGCAFCCHVSMVATAPEVFLVANYIREHYKDQFDTILERVRTADQTTRGLSSYERAVKRIPCALLKDNACTVYGARPGPCRGFTSTSMWACEQGFNGDQTAPVRTPIVWVTLRNAHMQALWGALAAAALPAERYEFHHALRIALETPDGEQRWLKGEDIFADVAREAPTDPATNAQNKRIIDTIVAGALGKEMQ